MSTRTAAITLSCDHINQCGLAKGKITPAVLLPLMA